jgi:hypothetical protein
MKRVDLIRTIEKTVLFLSGMEAIMIGIRTMRQVSLNLYPATGKLKNN